MKAAAIAASEQFFATLIRRCSTPVSRPLGSSLPASAHSTVEPRIVEELKLTARKMASIGVTSCATTYAAQRASYVLGTLAKMNAEAAIRAVTESTASAAQYVPHSHPVFAFVEAVLGVLASERDFAEDVLSHQFRTVWGRIVEPVLDELTRVVEAAERGVAVLCGEHPSRVYSYGLFITADVYSAYHGAMDKLDAITRLEVNKCSAFLDKPAASQKKQQALLAKALADFLGILELEQVPSPSGLVKQTTPHDGTVHEVTALVCCHRTFTLHHETAANNADGTKQFVTFLKKSMDHKETLEEIATQMALQSTIKKDSVGTSHLGSYIGLWHIPQSTRTNETNQKTRTKQCKQQTRCYKG